MSVIAPPRAAEIDLGALAANLRLLLPETLDVRADAYGHGSARVLRTARELVPGMRRVVTSAREDIAPELLEGLEVVHEGPPETAAEAVYGLTAASLPVMTLTAEIVMRKRIAAGEGVSYGFTYRPERDTFVALVAIGYSQGVARRASNRCDAYVGGTRCRIAGAISMDLLSVDIGDLDAGPGDRVELFGSQSRLTDWSAKTNIAPLALTSRLQHSIPRVEVRE